jgi:signal transduction histidine kinase
MKSFLQVMVAVMVMAVCIGSVFAGSKQDESMALVKKAVAYIKENGKEKAFAEFSNPTGKFVKGELYIFVYDSKGTNLAHGGNQKLIGKNLIDLSDSAGTFFVKDFIKVAKNGGGWTEYKWTNPVSKNIELKRSYIMPVADFVVGCGYYK